MRPPSTLLQLNAILVLFCAAAMLFTNEADGQQDTLGLGGFPVRAKGEVDLPSGYELVNDKDKFDKYYKDAKVKPCNVDFDKEGNIEVFYDNWASTLGCTLDLLVNDNKEIKFVAKVEDKEKCVTKDFIDNVLPFIFNEANNGLTTLTNGSIAGDEKDCPDKDNCDGHRRNCIKRTIFAIGWEREKGLIEGNLLQVGEPIDAWFVSGKADGANMDVKMAVGNVSEDQPLVTITSGAKSVEFPNGGSGKKPVCNYPRNATAPPTIWKVKSANQEFNGKYFVTFHFFPQNSPGASGPKCNAASFIFSKDYAAGLLLLTPPPTEPTTPKTSIAPETNTSIEPTTPETSNGTSSTGSTKTPASEPPATVPAPGLSVAAIVGIVAGAIALVVVVAVLVYCLCFRGKEEAEDEKEEEDEPVAAAEDEDVEKAEGELPAASE